MCVEHSDDRFKPGRRFGVRVNHEKIIDARRLRPWGFIQDAVNLDVNLGFYVSREGDGTGAVWGNTRGRCELKKGWVTCLRQRAIETWDNN